LTSKSTLHLAHRKQFVKDEDYGARCSGENSIHDITVQALEAVIFIQRPLQRYFHLIDGQSRDSTSASARKGKRGC
jgi:hypothetical protein